MLHKNAKVDLIRRAPIFAKLPKKQLAEVAALADEIDVDEGKELTTQGKPGREFFVLIEGTASVVRNGRKINTLGDGDFFGEISVVSGAPRTATVKAQTPVRALVLTQRDFRALLRRSPQIQEKILDALAERIPIEA